MAPSFRAPRLDEMTSLQAHHRIRVGGNGYRGVILRDSPAGYWPLDEVNGTMAIDSAGSNHGTFSPNSNGNWTGGTSGNSPGPINRENAGAAKSNGYNGFVYLPDAAIPIGTGGSLEAWIKGTDSIGGIIERYVGGVGVRLLAHTGQAVFQVGSSVAWGGLVKKIDDDAWHHVVGVWTGSAVSVWRDGEMLKSVAQSAAASTPPTNSTRIFLTLDLGWLANQIAHAAAYSYALSGAQIQHHYLAGIYGS